MDINKEAYIELVEKINKRTEELAEKILKNDDDQIENINNLYHVAKILRIDYDKSKILNWVTPDDIDNEIKKVKRESNLKFKISKEKEKDDYSIMSWNLSKSNRGDLTISLDKDGQIFCSNGGIDMFVALPTEIDWFVKDWQMVRWIFTMNNTIYFVNKAQNQRTPYGALSFYSGI